MTATTTAPMTTSLSTTSDDVASSSSSSSSRGFLFRGPSFSRCGARAERNDLATPQCSSSSSLTLGRATPTSDTTASNGKDALCRRMGTLFLRHKVEKLEDDVEKMQQQQQHRGRGSRCPVQRRVQQYAQQPNTSSTSVASATTASSTTLPSLTHDEMASRSSGENSSELQSSTCRREQQQCLPSRLCASRTWCKSKSMPAPVTESVTLLEQSLVAGYDGARRVTRIVVADVSLLIYSLRTVHQWLKAGDCHVVVPCEALSTLDVLKKGEHFLNLAARRATRFLDERFASVTSAAHDDAALADSNEPAPLKAGLYPQGMKERLDLSLPEAEGDDALTQAGISVAALSQAPLPVAKTLACALYFVRRYGARSDASCSLAIALPPPHIEFDSEDSSGSGGGGATASNLRYAERADGNHVLHWSKVCGLSNSDDGTATTKPRLIVAPTAASWLAAGPRGPSADVEEFHHKHGLGHHAQQHTAHHDHLRHPRHHRHHPHRS